PVATQLPHAVGLAYAAQYRGADVVVMAYFGDGATSEGDFHEALNFAGVCHVPVVFVCQNNQWAISVPLKKQTHSRTIAQKALAYGLPGIQVDGKIAEAIRRFEAMPPANPLTMFAHVYAELPPDLRAQREEIAARENTAAARPDETSTHQPGATPMRAQRLTRR